MAAKVANWWCDVSEIVVLFEEAASKRAASRFMALPPFSPTVGGFDERGHHSRRSAYVGAFSTRAGFRRTRHCPVTGTVQRDRAKLDIAFSASPW
jgi:hypothetical protein